MFSASTLKSWKTTNSCTTFGLRERGMGDGGREDRREGRGGVRRCLALGCVMEWWTMKKKYFQCSLVSSAANVSTCEEATDNAPRPSPYWQARVWAVYTWPGSNWRPSACEADVIATRPQVLVLILKTKLAYQLCYKGLVPARNALKS